MQPERRSCWAANWAGRACSTGTEVTRLRREGPLPRVASPLTPNHCSGAPLCTQGLVEHGLSSVMSGMDNVRNMTGSPIAGIDPHEFLDVRPLNYGAPLARRPSRVA